jgi:hypothetical protein
VSRFVRSVLLSNLDYRILTGRLSGGGFDTARAKSGVSEFANSCKWLKINRSTRCGRVAQLGEHLLCKQGVAGSIPATSTIFSAIYVFFLRHAFAAMLSSNVYRGAQPFPRPRVPQQIAWKFELCVKKLLAIAS